MGSMAPHSTPKALAPPKPSPGLVAQAQELARERPWQRVELGDRIGLPTLTNGVWRATFPVRGGGSAPQLDRWVELCNDVAEREFKSDLVVTLVSSNGVSTATAQWAVSEQFPPNQLRSAIDHVVASANELQAQEMSEPSAPPPTADTVEWADAFDGNLASDHPSSGADKP